MMLYLSAVNVIGLGWFEAQVAWNLLFLSVVGLNDLLVNKQCADLCKRTSVQILSTLKY